MEEPAPLNPALQQAMDDALRPSFGENLPKYYGEVERHQAETRDLIDRALRVTQELINDTLDRLTFIGGDRAAFLGEAHQNTAARRGDVDKELHEALVEAKGRHHVE